ncbi:hypothetical protein D3C78_1145030 [compost metagenome]
MNSIPSPADNIPPSEYPLNMIATRVLRDFFGAYSFIRATTFGITPPIPRPAMKRHSAKISGLDAKPFNAVTPLNSSTQIMMVLRRPIRSEIDPKNKAPSIIPTSAQLPNAPACSELSPHSDMSDGNTTP